MTKGMVRAGAVLVVGAVLALAGCTGDGGGGATGDSSQLAGWAESGECPSSEAVTAAAGSDLPARSEELSQISGWPEGVLTCPYGDPNGGLIVVLFMFPEESFSGRMTGPEALADLRERNTAQEGMMAADEPRLGEGGWRAWHESLEEGSGCSVGTYRDERLISVAVAEDTTEGVEEYCELAIEIALQ